MSDLRYYSRAAAMWLIRPVLTNFVLKFLNTNFVGKSLNCEESASQSSEANSRRRRLFSERFENAPASIAASAISIAACDDFTSIPVTNLASFGRSAITIMARHARCSLATFRALVQMP
jgi:hypothetical protein